MIALPLALDKVRGRPASAAATAASLMLAVILLLVVANAHDVIVRRIHEPAADADLIVGPKGGSLDLFLSAGLHLAPSRGRLSPGLVEDLAADHRVSRIAPIALDDDVHGWPVIATNGRHPLFVHNDDLADLLDGDEPVAVAGATVARALGLSPGMRLRASHDAVEGRELEIAAVLGPRSAIADRCLYVPIASRAHAHQATDRHVHADAAIVVLGTPLDLLPMLRELNELDEVTAVDPRSEAARLRAALGEIDGYLWAAAAAVLALALLSYVTALVGQAQERRREAAILRALGASFIDVMAVEVTHAVLVAGAGAALGTLLGAGAAWLLGLKDGLLLLDLLVPAGAVFLAALVAVATCLPLYRVPLDETLRPDR